MTVRRGKMSQHVIAPIAALVAVAMGVVVSFVWFSARNQDQIALQQSIDGGAERRRTARDAGRPGGQGLRLVERCGAQPGARLRSRVGGSEHRFYVFENHGYEMSFVVDGQDRTTYASAEDSRIAADAFDMLRHGLQELIAEARSAPLDKPEPAFGLLRSSAGDVLLVG